jgi:hypothetical protein
MTSCSTVEHHDAATQLKEGIIAAMTALLIPRSRMAPADRGALQTLWNNNNLAKPDADRILSSECARLAIKYKAPEIESRLRKAMSKFFSPAT